MTGLQNLLSSGTLMYTLYVDGIILIVPLLVVQFILKFHLQIILIKISNLGNYRILLLKAYNLRKVNTPMCFYMDIQ